MTILTKLLLKKFNLEKIPLPLALGGDLNGPNNQDCKNALPEDQRSYSEDYDEESMTFNNDKYSCYKSLIIFVTIVFLIVLGGLGAYMFYTSNVHTYPKVQYRGMCDIPYIQDSSSSPRFYLSPEDDAFVMDWRRFLYDEPPTTTSADPERYFREEINIINAGLNDSFAKIEVPEFKERRSGRFMHDFKDNQSAIVDTASNRCFIMPLDRNTTLPPSSLQDLLEKMQSGYYNIDTERIRQNMRVVTPEITDRSAISLRIANECYDMNMYKIENIELSVYKRSIDGIEETGKYAEFIGKGIVEFNLLNIGEVNQYEAEQQKLN